MSVPPDAFSLDGKDYALTPDLRIAVEHLRAGKLQQAQALLARHVVQYPESDQAWFLLSFAVSDSKQQIECLQRALTINPANTAAGARLTRLRSAQQPLQPVGGRAAPPPVAPAAKVEQPVASATPAPKAAAPVAEAAPPPKPRPSAAAARPEPAWMPGDSAAPAIEISEPPKAKKRGGCGRWLRAFLIVWLVLLGLAAVLALIWALFTFLPRQTRLIATPTAIAPATLPPTWTATTSPTPTLTPTVTITPSPTPTRTPMPPEPTTAAAMVQIAREVADLRGLAPLSPVAGYLLPADDVRPVLESSFLANGGTQAELDDEVRVLSALGLVKPTYNLYNNSLNSLTDSLGGFYFPWSKELFVIGREFSGIERWVYSHEYAHALVDQHNGLGELGVYPECTRTLDECSAIRALVEGDASLVMAQWLNQYAGPKDYQDIANYNAPAQTLPEQFPPDYLIQQSQFPYVAGLDFVGTLHQQGNWAQVNKAFARLPASTEQILHPDKYLAGEAPQQAASPDLSATLGDEWRKLDSDTLGEWGTFLLLGYGADLEAQLALGTAESAAAGWGGDNFQVYVREADEAPLMSALWLWDTNGDASAFSRAMQQHLDGRFRGGEVATPSGECWSANAQYTCLFTSGRQTLWILAPDDFTLQAIRKLYPGFS